MKISIVKYATNKLVPGHYFIWVNFPKYHKWIQEAIP